MGQKPRSRPERLAAKLLAIRRHLGISQIKMARLINFDGHYSRLSEWESGRRQPDVVVMLAYARAAKIPLESLVDDEIELPF